MEEALTLALMVLSDVCTAEPRRTAGLSRSRGFMRNLFNFMRHPELLEWSLGLLLAAGDELFPLSSVDKYDPPPLPFPPPLSPSQGNLISAEISERRQHNLPSGETSERLLALSSSLPGLVESLSPKGLALFCRALAGSDLY